MPPQEGEQVTRARCAECGAVLATEWEHKSVWVDMVGMNAPATGKARGALLVHPCGACLQEARADAIAGYAADREPPVDEGRD